MSSLTDIIFLLLIFFMLTSTVVAPHALNLKLPGRTDTPAQPSSNQKLDDVSIDGAGEFYLNDRRLGKEALEERLRAIAGTGAAIIISPTKDAPVEGVVTVMDIAMRLEIESVLAAEE